MAHLELGSMLQLTDVSEIMSWKHTDILENNKVQTAPNSLEAKLGDKPEKQITPASRRELPCCTSLMGTCIPLLLLFPSRLEKQTLSLRTLWQTRLLCKCEELQMTAGSVLPGKSKARAVPTLSPRHAPSWGAARLPRVIPPLQLHRPCRDKGKYNNCRAHQQNKW